ncbi:hypothetical protein RJT34_23912 [Clitoria ternatea]|uniref:Uncharacterized protein n=1 Tax=Clitoria ternatea TaxID=43366 RepID=A0AAN9IFE3_CLITE
MFPLRTGYWGQEDLKKERVDLVAKRPMKVDHEGRNKLLPKVLFTDELLNDLGMSWDGSLVIKLLRKRVDYNVSETKGINLSTDEYEDDDIISNNEETEDMTMDEELGVLSSIHHYEARGHYVALVVKSVSLRVKVMESWDQAISLVVYDKWVCTGLYASPIPHERIKCWHYFGSGAFGPYSLGPLFYFVAKWWLEVGLEKIDCPFKFEAAWISHPEYLLNSLGSLGRR